LLLPPSHFHSELFQASEERKQRKSNRYIPILLPIRYEADDLHRLFRKNSQHLKEPSCKHTEALLLPDILPACGETTAIQLVPLFT
jgi:hypothetical protein